MNAVVVSLRYRPAAGVLVGEVDLPDVQLFTDVVDDDVVLRWQATLQGEVLHSFQLVDARARLSDNAHELPLPDHLSRELRRFVAHAPDEPLVEGELVLTPSLLRRPRRTHTRA